MPVLPQSECERSRGFFAAQSRGRPVVQPHSERETVRLQNFLELRQGLLAEVRRPQQLDFGPLDQIADVVDVFCLQAVRRTYGELELVDGAQQDRVDLRLGATVANLVLTLKIDE